MKAVRRVLVVDSGPTWSLGASFVRGLQTLGHDAQLFDEGPWLGLQGSGGLAGRVAARLLRPAAVPVMNLALLTRTFAFRPDVVLVMKGGLLLPETVAALRRGAGRVAVYHPDDLENPLNTNRNMLDALPLWDAVFTPRVFAVPELEARGAKAAAHVPFGWDPHLHHPPVAAAPPCPVDRHAVFVGSWAPERALLFELIAERFPVRIWGNGWERVPAGSPLAPALERRSLLGEPLNAVFHGAALNVALLRKANRDRHQMRTFEVPACGGFLLAERTEEHRALYEEEREAAFFEGPEEFAEACARWLPDEAGRRAVAEAGRRRLVAGGHTYADRARSILRVIDAP